MKSDLYTDLHIHWFSVFEGGLEAPLLDGFDRLCVQPVAQATDNTYIAGVTRLIDDHPENTRSLSFRLTSFFGVFRVRGRNCPGSRYSATDFKYASADAATATSTYPWAVTYADSTTRTGTYAAT
jgi:hypothetical protein